MTFALDNFVTNVQNGGGGPLSQGVLMLIGCSYLIVLLSNMKRLDLIPSKAQHINFYDGFYMHIDGSYISRFLVLFSKTLKRLTHLDTFVIPHRYFSSITVPKYFNKLFPEMTASINATHVTLDGNAYPLFPNNPTPNQVYYPHTKQQFFKNVKATPNDKDLWYLNFLRDAFKTDVAHETDSIFITHDRLAFTYYKLIGGKHGFLISLDVTTRQHSTQQCEYNVVF